MYSDYYVATGEGLTVEDSAAFLEESVRQGLGDGYRPYGSLQVCVIETKHGETEVYLIQPMVRVALGEGAEE